MYAYSLSLLTTGIYGASLCTLPMVVSLRGTSGGSIDDLCVVFFHNVYNLCVTRNIIRKGVHVKKIGAQIEVKGGAKGQGEVNGLPHAGQGLAKVQIL